MKNYIFKTALLLLLTGAFLSSQAQLNWEIGGNTSSNTSDIFGLQNPEDIHFVTGNQFRMSLTQTGRLGLGTQDPRAWQEILYCKPYFPIADVGFIVTQKECGPPPIMDWTMPDVFGAGLNVVPWTGNIEPNLEPIFNVPPNAFLTGSNSNVTSPLFPSSEAPLIWARVEYTPQYGPSTNRFDTRFIVMPTGNVGINIAMPRAALDVRGSNGVNRVAAIIGSRALGTHMTDANGLTKFKTQQVHFVPILGGNGYNQITIADDQGMFFTDGKGIEGANQNGCFVLAPWAENRDPNVGGMRMDHHGNTEFHGTLKATELNIKTVWWSDFVFAPDYKLMPLSEVEAFILKNKHLPEIPSEKEVLENGINVADMQALQQQKIEELTLYTIEQEKKILAQQKKLEELGAKLLILLNK